MYKLCEVLPSGSMGERLLLKVNDDEGNSVSLNISATAYCKMGLKKGAIDEETYKKLISCTSFEQAVIKGMNILGYGINSEKKLKYKLRMKGFSEKNSDLAVEYLKDHGYIDESNDVIRLCESLICKKYGPRRILSDIKNKGYCGEAFCTAQNYLKNIDFNDLCVDVIKLKFKKLPTEPVEMKKAIAKLVSLGYNVSEIKNALKKINLKE